MRRSLKSHIAFTTIILNINSSKNVHTWNKRRTNFPRKFAKLKVVAVPALKQGTLVIMTKMSKRDGEEKISKTSWHLFQVRCLAAWPETDGELLLLEHQRLHGRHRRHGATPRGALQRHPSFLRVNQRLIFLEVPIF